MPEVLERCVKHLMDDPKFKPKKKGQTKKEAAWAVCTAAQNKKKLTEDNFDADMKIIFSEWDQYIQFDEEIATVTEELAKDKSSILLWDHVRALENSVFRILDDQNITDKKDKIKSSVKEFGDLLSAELDKLGKFTEQKGETITFTTGIDKYEIVDLGEKVKINNLPIFMLGNHRGFNYDENWAKNVAIARFEQNKGTGHLPGICIQHTYDEGGHPVPKAVKSFFDNLRLKDDVIYCDTLPIDKELARDFPYRSVEINPNTRGIDALAIHGVESVPYFKFPPVMFDEGKDTGDKKIIITFFDENFKQNEGGEKMNQKISEEEKKNFIQSIVGAVEDFFKKKGEQPKVELFTEEEVKTREEEAKKDAKKEAQDKFMEEQKKAEAEVLMKDLFGENGRKEGYVLAPNLKNRVKALFDSVSNQSKIKFTEETGTDADKKTVEKELTQFATVKEIFTEILKAPETALVELGEKTKFFELPNTTEKEKFDEKKLEDLGSKAAEKYGAKKKEDKK